MYHELISSEQLLSEAGYQISPNFFSVTTANDLRQLLKLRSLHKIDIAANSLVDTDYFLVSCDKGNSDLATAIGGLPICNRNWQWPMIGKQPLYYFGRINLADSIDLLPFGMREWAEKSVMQVFIADFYIGDPSTEISVHVVDLTQDIFRYTELPSSQNWLLLPKIPMMRARIKVGPFVDYDDTLEDLALCNIWNPKGTRIPMSYTSKSKACFDISGLDLDQSVPERSMELGLNVKSLDSDTVSLLQLSGGSIRICIEFKPQLCITTEFECD